MFRLLGKQLVRSIGCACCEFSLKNVQFLSVLWAFFLLFLISVYLKFNILYLFRNFFFLLFIFINIFYLPVKGTQDTKK